MGMVARRELQGPATRLPQRALRNDISRVLREAEGGERFAITVNGRVVAELGPPREQPKGTDWQTAHAVIARARSKADPTYWDDVTREPMDLEDSWQRAERRNT